MIRMVFAVSEVQFQEWCFSNDINPRDRTVARRLRDVQDLRGLGQPITVEVLPGFWDTPGAQQSKIDLYYYAMHVQERNKDLLDPGPTSR